MDVEGVVDAPSRRPFLAELWGGVGGREGMRVAMVTLLAGGGGEGVAVSESIGVMAEGGTGVAQRVILCAEGVRVGVEAGGTAAEGGAT